MMRLFPSHWPSSLDKYHQLDLLLHARTCSVGVGWDSSIQARSGSQTPILFVLFKLVYTFPCVLGTTPWVSCRLPNYAV